MGAFANGFPNRTLAQFKELHAGDVRGIAGLTEDEYKYATQVAVWATCGQLSVPSTSFTAGRAALVEPTSDAQQIRVFDSVKAILRLANGWTKYLYTGMYLRAEEDRDVRGVEVLNEYGLEGAAADNEDGIKKETIGGKEYYTRVMYVASATSTWIDGYTTKVYSTDAPQGTIFTAENGASLEAVQENGATCYKVDTSKQRDTNLNANGTEYYGAYVPRQMGQWPRSGGSDGTGPLLCHATGPGAKTRSQRLYQIQSAAQNKTRRTGTVIIKSMKGSAVQKINRAGASPARNYFERRCDNAG